MAEMSDVVIDRRHTQRKNGGGDEDDKDASLRRQLNRRGTNRHSLHCEVGQDLSAMSREDLEKEVLGLRTAQNKHTAEKLQAEADMRDMMSHSSGGKSEDSLALNKTAEPEQKPLGEILAAAGKRALGGGLPGAAAMGIQVGTLMWMRTTMNYQYRHGTSTGQALKALYADGGIPRFYKGVVPALIQGPMSRFGDTAANAGMLALLGSFGATRDLPIAAKTLTASAAAASFRVFLMPVDTVKTIMQVEGAKGLPMLSAKFKANGPKVFYGGALAASAATFAGHYPWFATFNTLQEKVPQQDVLWKKLARNAGIGFCASFVSDCTSNSIRVVKTTKQTHANNITYPQAVKEIIAKDGVQGLFFRGLKTRILANGAQGMMFSVLWKFFEDQLAEKTGSQQ